jgi:hypothetical protein
MTVQNELIKLGNSRIENGDSQLFLPEYCMPELVNTSIPTEEDLLVEDSGQKYPFGSKLVKRDGIWRYSKAGAAMAAYGFLKGNYTIIPGSGGNNLGYGYEGAAYAAAAAGDTAIKITDTAAAKNLYQGGLLTIYNDTDKRYYDYEVIGNDVSTGVYTIIYIAPPGLKDALTTAYGIDVYLSPYANIRGLSGGYMSAMGYAKMNITSGYCFWLFTAGRISGITGASTWPGQTQYYRDVYANTDGSLITYNAGYQRIGYLLFRTAFNYGDNTIMLQLDQ